MANRKKTRAFLSGAIAATLSAASPVRAADPAFCRDYATAAVNQVRTGLSNPGCVGHMRGQRWSLDYNIHFQGCLGASIAAAGGERTARAKLLHVCAEP
jgi:hypothetical protein